MANAIIVCALVVIVIFSVKSYIKKLRSGCCGGGSDEAVKPTDTNEEHYPYNAVIKITGMTCGGCTRRVENALNMQSGVWARADLKSDSVNVLMKTRLSDTVLRGCIIRTGYGVESIIWRK